MARCAVLLLAHGDIPGATGDTPCPRGETPSPLPGCPEGGQMSPWPQTKAPRGRGAEPGAQTPLSRGGFRAALFTPGRGNSSEPARPISRAAASRLCARGPINHCGERAPAARFPVTQPRPLRGCISSGDGASNLIPCHGTPRDLGGFRTGALSACYQPRRGLSPLAAGLTARVGTRQSGCLAASAPGSQPAASPPLPSHWDFPAGFLTGDAGTRGGTSYPTPELRQMEQGSGWGCWGSSTPRHRGSSPNYPPCPGKAAGVGERRAEHASFWDGNGEGASLLPAWGRLPSPRPGISRG